MNKRVVPAAALLGMVLLLAALSTGLVGCGPSDSTTTVPPTTTAKTEPSETATAAVTTTSAPEQAGLSAPFVEKTGPPLEQYRSEMRAFGRALEDLPTTDDPSYFTDVTAVTGAQLEAAREYVAGLQSAIAQLKTIQPPTKIADAHQEVVAGIEALAATTDKLMIATENKDQAAFDAALTEGQVAVEALQASMEALGSLLADNTPST